MGITKMNPQFCQNKTRKYLIDLLYEVFFDLLLFAKHSVRYLGLGS